MNYLRENKENNPIYNSIKNNKIFKNMCNQGGEKISTLEKTLMTEIEEHTNKWKETLCS